MKTKISLFLFLLMVISVTRLSAQNSRDVYNWPVPEFVLTQEIFCDGLLVDVLQNTTPYILMCRDKYKSGQFVAYNQHLNNIPFKSLMTDETFILQGHEKGTIDPLLQIGYAQVTGVFIGNKGSRYVTFAHYELDMVTWILTYTDSRTSCH